MRGAIYFHRPAGQQQAQDNTEKHLFLFRQAFHVDTVSNNEIAATVAWRLPVKAQNSEALCRDAAAKPEFEICDSRLKRQTPNDR
jgi:hypothetical protein